MRATGILRRVDDLGRIVIPKQIRELMSIRDGEAMEIFTDASQEMVCFQKAEPPIITLEDELRKIYARHESEMSAVKKVYFDQLLQVCDLEEE